MLVNIRVWLEHSVESFIENIIFLEIFKTEFISENYAEYR